MKKRAKKKKFPLLLVCTAAILSFHYVSHPEALPEPVTAFLSGIRESNGIFLSDLFPDSASLPAWSDSLPDSTPASSQPDSALDSTSPPAQPDSLPDSTSASSQPDTSLGNSPVPAWYESLPPYTGDPWIQINGGIPFFTEAELSTEAFEHYSDLDALGRCGPAYANVCPETMPTQPRGQIGTVRPSGWHTVKYDIISDRYLYNRGHLIGYQLTGENANDRNLFTCTRYLNVEGMLPWESRIADYVKDTGNHVLYRVTPYFHGENLVASGVLMEAYSVEDAGAGLCFNVYGYNVQPGIVIDYSTGDSHADAVLLAPGAD